jgi:quercetin dioxygenase-like cupin family protein
MTTTSTSTTSSIRHVPHSQGETHPVMGDPMRFIMTAEQTGGAYALAEQEIRPGNGAPPHTHHNEDESFYILEGEFAATVDGVEKRLSKGDYIHIPRGRVRSFTNIGRSHGRLLILHVPGSASGFYIAMGKLPFPPDMADVAALAARHGIELAPSQP